MRRLRADKRRVETISEPKAGKYLTFRVARQDFAMSADFVRGILPVHEMVALETPHQWICGFAALGGRDFPVIDLRAKLEIPHGSHGREPFIVVVEAGDRLAGFVADRVSEVLELRARDFRNGAVRTNGRPRKVLDPDQIMTTDDWVVARASACSAGFSRRPNLA
jgi:purine-binding chemotaxis protein CheW